MGLSFRNLRKIRPPDIFAKIVTMGTRTEDNVRVGVLPLGKVVWRFISERSVIISVGLSFRNLQTPDIFPKIITMGVRTENKMRLGVLRYYGN